MTLAAALALGFMWLLTPRLYGPFTDHLHKEDGLIFLSGVQHGRPILETYTGYLHVGPRLMTAACTLLPAEGMTTCLAAGSGLVRVALALLLVAVMTPYLRHWGWAVAAGALVLFGGVGQQEVLGNLTNLRWFLDVAATVALLGSFRRARLAVLAVSLSWMAALSDPLALLLTPVAAWRAVSLRGAGRVVPVAFLPAAALHFTLLDSQARESFLAHYLADPIRHVPTIVVRSFTETALGETGATVALRLAPPIIVALLTLGFFGLVGVLSFRQMDQQQAVMCALLTSAGLLFLVATVAFASPEDIIATAGLARASRYALIPSLLIGAALVLMVSELPSNPLGACLRVLACALVVLGSIADSRGDEWATRGPSWVETVRQTRQDCATIGGVQTVDATPQGVPMKWTADLNCHWLQKDH